MKHEDITPGLKCAWTQRNADTQFQPNAVAATVLRVGRLVTIEARDSQGKRIVRRVSAESLRVRER